MNYTRICLIFQTLLVSYQAENNSSIAELFSAERSQVVYTGEGVSK